MKKIILIFLILFISNFAYSDCEDNDCITDWEDSEEYLALGINNPITIPGSTGSSGYIFNENFNGYTDVDDGVFTESEDAEWDTDDSTAQFTSSEANDMGNIYYDLPSEYDSFMVEFDLSIDDLTVADSTIAYTEIARIRDSADGLLLKVWWYGPGSCGSPPCDLDRVRCRYYTDGGEVSSGLADVTSNFADGVANTWKIYYEKDDNGDSASGIVRIYIDGNLDIEITNIDNDAGNQVDEIVIGPTSSDLDATTSDGLVLDFDDVKGDEEAF